MNSQVINTNNQPHINIDNSHWSGIFSSNNTSRNFGLHGIYNNSNAANASKIIGGKNKFKNSKFKNITNKYKNMKHSNKKRSMKRSMKKSMKKKMYKNFSLMSNRQYGLAGGNNSNTNVNTNTNTTTNNNANMNTNTNDIVNPYSPLNIASAAGAYTDNINTNIQPSVNHQGGRRKRNRKSKKRITKRKLMRGGNGNGNSNFPQFSSNIPNTTSYSTGGILSPNNSALANPVPYTKLSNCVNCIDNYNYNTNKGFQFW